MDNIMNNTDSKNQYQIILNAKYYIIFIVLYQQVLIEPILSWTNIR